MTGETNTHSLGRAFTAQGMFDTLDMVDEFAENRGFGHV